MLQNKMINPTTNLFRPINTLVYGWVGGKYVCVDLHAVFQLVGLGIETFTLGQATLKAASSNKVVKQEKMSYENQHDLIPCNI